LSALGSWQMDRKRAFIQTQARSSLWEHAGTFHGQIYKEF